MEAKNSEVFRKNSSSNFSHALNSTSRVYVFAPVSSRVKFIIFTALLLFGVYGFVANSFILYVKHKKRRQRHGPGQRPRYVTQYFVISLVLADLLACLISLPLYAAEVLIDFVKTDLICSVCRLFSALFPTVTIFNLLVIGVERYLAIFHPFSIVRRRKAKRMVVGAWILGSLLSLAIAPVFRLVHHKNISDDSFTFVCKYDSSAPLYKALFMGFNLISFIFPSCILTFINIRILRRQRDSQRVDASRNTQRALSRLKVTRMFVSLIFAFIIPFTTFFLYSSIRTAVKMNISFTDDYIVRRISAILLFANGSVSATILIYYEKLYLDFMSCFRSRSANNQGTPRIKRAVPSNIGGNNENEECTPV